MLRRQAARGKHRPWLFWPDGWDWRWLSWGVAEARVAALVRLLGPALAGLETASRASGRPMVVHPWRGDPASLLLDQALISAGGSSLPWPVSRVGAMEAPAGAWWLALPGESTEPPPGSRPLPLADPRQRVAELLRVEGTLTGAGTGEPAEGGDTADAPAGVEASSEGGAMVSEGPGDLHSVPWPDLLEGAEQLATSLARAPAVGKAKPEREILVFAGEPWQAARRRLLTWALIRGAALVLEPRPASLVGTAVWARPTIFAGTPSQVAELLLRVMPGEPAGRWRRLWQGWRPPPPLGALTGRLHTCLVLPPAGRADSARDVIDRDLQELVGDAPLRILYVGARITSSPRRNSTEELND